MHFLYFCIFIVLITYLILDLFSAARITLVDRVEPVVITCEQKTANKVSRGTEQLILFVELCNVREIVDICDILTSGLLENFTLQGRTK